MQRMSAKELLTGGVDQDLLQISEKSSRVFKIQTSAGCEIRRRNLRE